jgi:beta-glucanase (GH16 family)
MVKKKPDRGIRLLLSLAVVVAVGVAAGLALSTSSHAPAPVHRPALTTPRRTTPSATTTTPVTRTPQPLGAPGRWRLVFRSEFNGNSLDQAVWNAHNGWTDQNGVADSLANVTVDQGHAVLTLASAQSGAEIGTNSFRLKIGEFAQARIDFAGHGATIYNWPAFWTSGPDWPHGGENDIAEGFGALTVNYHSPTVTHMSGRIPGVYAGAFHVYGIYRGPDYTRVYWDGKVVGAYKTYDDGRPQTLLLTLGAGNHVVTGAAGAMIVDYVRAWAPASAH